jgi:hypothetical protein
MVLYRTGSDNMHLYGWILEEAALIPNPDICVQCQEYSFTTQIEKH